MKFGRIRGWATRRRASSPGSSNHLTNQGPSSKTELIRRKPAGQFHPGANTTAYELRKRFMPVLEKHQPAMLAGVLEADESFFRRSYKGQRGGLPRKRYKRGTPAEKRGINDDTLRC